MTISKTIFDAIFPKKKYENIGMSKELKYENIYGEKISIQISFGNIFIYHSDIQDRPIEIIEALTKYTFNEDEYNFIFKAIKKLIKNN
jgi:hypothetical protein